MAGFWVSSFCMLQICVMCTICSTSSYPLTPEVSQPDALLCADTGSSALLRCCIYGKSVGVITWFKQPNRKRPHIIGNVFKSSVEIIHNEFLNPRFQLGRSLNCCSMNISRIMRSDEAMYYCAIISPYIILGNGTYLKIRETSRPDQCDNSVVCEATTHENSTNLNTQEKKVSEVIRSLHWTVVGLGSALGLSAILIFCLTYLMLRRRKCEKMNASLEDSSGMRQESDAEMVNYAALQFSKRKAKAEKRHAVSRECVYSYVKQNIAI